MAVKAVGVLLPGNVKMSCDIGLLDCSVTPLLFFIYLRESLWQTSYDTFCEYDATKQTEAEKETHAFLKHINGMWALTTTRDVESEDLGYTRNSRPTWKPYP